MDIFGNLENNSTFLQKMPDGLRPDERLSSFMRCHHQPSVQYTNSSHSYLKEFPSDRNAAQQRKAMEPALAQSLHRSAVSMACQSNNHTGNLSSQSTHNALAEAKDLVNSLNAPAQSRTEVGSVSNQSTTGNNNNSSSMHTALHNTVPAVPPPPAPCTAKYDSIQGRRASESRTEYLHRVLDRVTELGERKPTAKKEAPSIHGNTPQEASPPPPPPPPPSYDEALALGLFLDEKLALTEGLHEEGTSYATASSHSHGNDSRRSLRRSRQPNHTFSQTQAVDNDHHTQHDQPSSHPQSTRLRSARKGSLVERAHSLASEESVRAEMELIQREFAAEDDEDTSTKMSRSTNRSRDSIYKYPPALDATTQGTEEEFESGGSLPLVTRRENLPSMRDAQSRPYVG